MEQTIYVNDKEAASRFLFRPSLPFHCRAQAISDTDSAATCPEHDDLLLLQTLSSHLDSANYCPQCDRCGHTGGSNWRCQGGWKEFEGATDRHARGRWQRNRCR